MDRRRLVLASLVLAAVASAADQPCGPPGEIQCYEVKPADFPVVPVTVEDRFGVRTYPLRYPHRLCAPTGPGDGTSAGFLMGYTVDEDALRSPGHRVVNRFGTTLVDLLRPELLLVPTAASVAGPPGPDASPDGVHYQCWQAQTSAASPPFEPVRGVEVVDALETVTVDLLEPSRLCVPASTNGDDPLATARPFDLLCYTTQSPMAFGDEDVHTQNPFGADEVRLIHRRELCVPSLTDREGSAPPPGCTTTTTVPATTTTTNPTTTTTTVVAASTTTTTSTSSTSLAPSTTTSTTRPPSCGDGVVDAIAGEECDDGNTLPGDCCSPSCRFEPDGSPCDDGDVCDGDDRCRAGRCEAVPAAVGAACRRSFALAAVSNFRGDSVSLVDGPSSQVTATVPVGDGPWGVALHPAGREIWVSNRGGSSVSVVDIASGTVVATIRVGRVPLGIVLDRSGARAYVASYGGNRVDVIDTASRAPLARWRVDRGPSGLAFDDTGRTLYVAHYAADTVLALDAATGRVLARIPTGHEPTQLGIDEPRGRMYVTNFGGGSVTVIGLVSRTALATIAVGRKPFGLAIDAARARAYVTNAGQDVVTVVDTVGNVVLTRWPVPPGPLGIGVDPEGRILVTSGAAGVLSFLDPAGGAVTAIAVGSLPVAYGQFIGTAANDCPATAPSCEDVDPTLLAQCGPRVGCEVAPRPGPDALAALLDAMAGTIRDAAPGTFHDAGLANALAASVGRTLGALGTGGQPTIRAELRGFLQVLRRGLSRGGVASDTGLRLLDLSRRARVLAHVVAR